MKQLFALAFLGFATFALPVSAEECAQSQPTTECNRSTNGPTWDGTGAVQNAIEVEVCHGYWHLLDVGTYRGRSTKWWSPIMKYGDWYGDLPTVTKPCKTYWVRPGTELRLYASCVEALITTGPMRRSGKYVMKEI